MKIIFDDEKQKRAFLRDMACECPGHYLDDVNECDICHKHECCAECWESVIEMEVKEDKE